MLIRGLEREEGGAGEKERVGLARASTRRNLRHLADVLIASAASVAHAAATYSCLDSS